MEHGYNKNLYILPFDHRSSFMKKMFGIDGRQPTAEETELIASYKQIIYDGFRLAVDRGGVPKDAAAILTDEQFGDGVITDAVQAGYTVCVAAEKSGQDEFDFEYGDQFGAHIEKYSPTFVKVLIRYNPEEDATLNQRQAERLKKLSDFCQQKNIKFIIEPLVPATTEQLESVNGDKNRYDNELRPNLMVTMVAELQNAGVEPDVWKIEGLEHQEDYQKIIAQMRSGGRSYVGAIVLGRGADTTQVEKWLRAGANVDGVIGFAVGRTIFWQPLVDYKERKIDEGQAAQRIADSFQHFYEVFSSGKE